MVIKGMVMISDIEGASTAHLTLFNISVMKKLITMLEVMRSILPLNLPHQTAFPMKPKAEHVLNMPAIFESMHNLVMVSIHY